MKKICFALATILMLTMCASCTLGKQEIVLTTENFEEYFDLERVVLNHNVSETDSKTLLGVYVPGSYSAQADIGVNISPKTTLATKDVVVEVIVYSWGFGTKWDIQEKTMTLHLSQDGSASDHFSIQCEEVLLKSSLPDPESGYVEVKSIEGKIYI